MKIGVFGSEYQLGKQMLLRRLFQKMEELDQEVYIDTVFYNFLTTQLDIKLKYAGLIVDNDFDVEVVLSIGGDGTFLRTAERVGDKNIPILGINTGRLGFLADVSSNEIEETLDEIFKNYYKIEDRSLLELQALGQKVEGYNFALNEIALLKRDTSSMITIHTYIDEDYLTSYQCDGLVVATPTGSTAYSMSVNGPIVVPQSRSFILSPVAPHTLSVRPLVISDSCTIKLRVEGRNPYFLVSLDGRSQSIKMESELIIKKASFTAKVVKRYNHTFYQTLREKLMWGADVRDTK